MTSPDTPAEDTAEILDRRTVRFTDTEWREIRQHAATVDRDRSTWIRHACHTQMARERDALVESRIAAQHAEGIYLGVQGQNYVPGITL